MLTIQIKRLKKFTHVGLIIENVCICLPYIGIFAAVAEYQA